MSDPAIDAAFRAWGRDGLPTTTVVNAAREALAPLRELHYPVSNCRCCSDHRPLCAHCGGLRGHPAASNAHWPCPTARLIYAKEEL